MDVSGETARSNVLPVKIHARLDPQGVTSAKANRGNARADQIIEKSWRLIGWQDDLQAVFTGITGACDEPVTVGAAFEGFELLDKVATGLGHQLGNFVPGMGALDGQHRQFGTLVELYIKTVEMRLHPRQVLIAGRGIDHQAITALRGDRRSCRRRYRRAH